MVLNVPTCTVHDLKQYQEKKISMEIECVGKLEIIKRERKWWEYFTAAGGENYAAFHYAKFCNCNFLIPFKEKIPLAATWELLWEPWKSFSFTHICLHLLGVPGPGHYSPAGDEWAGGNLSHRLFQETSTCFPGHRIQPAGSETYFGDMSLWQKTTTCDVCHLPLPPFI